MRGKLPLLWHIHALRRIRVAANSPRMHLSHPIWRNRHLCFGSDWSILHLLMFTMWSIICVQNIIIISHIKNKFRSVCHFCCIERMRDNQKIVVSDCSLKSNNNYYKQWLTGDGIDFETGSTEKHCANKICILLNFMEFSLELIVPFHRWREMLWASFRWR